MFLRQLNGLGAPIKEFPGVGKNFVQKFLPPAPTGHYYTAPQSRAPKKYRLFTGYHLTVTSGKGVARG